MAPEDRKGQGLVLDRSIAENFALSDRNGASKFGIALPRWVNNQVKDWVARADIRPPDPRYVVRRLSGGNQQRSCCRVARLLPKVLIADEPTRGVDVGAKAAIHQMIADAAASGIGVLLISSELEELMGLPHRVIVFRKGRVVAEFEEGAADRQAIIAAAFGTVLERASPPAPAPAVTGTAESRAKRKLSPRDYGIIAFLVLIAAGLSVSSSSFRTMSNVANMLNQMSWEGIAAWGRPRPSSPGGSTCPRGRSMRFAPSSPCSWPAASVPSAPSPSPWSSGLAWAWSTAPSLPSAA